MKHLSAVLLMMLWAAAGAQQPFPSFRPLRYDEDYSGLKGDTVKSWYRNMKYAPFSRRGGTYMSLGGEVRYQYFNFRNEDQGRLQRTATVMPCPGFWGLRICSAEITSGSNFSDSEVRLTVYTHSLITGNKERISTCAPPTSSMQEGSPL